MPVDLPPRVRETIRRYAQGDRDLQELAEQATGAVRYALDRAVAHKHSPSEFPLPADESSLERRFLAALDGVPREGAAAFAAPARARLSPPPRGASAATVAAARAKRRAAYGFAGDHEPTDPAPVQRAVARLVPARDLRANASRAARRHGPVPPDARPGGGVRPPARPSGGAARAVARPSGSVKAPGNVAPGARRPVGGGGAPIKMPGNVGLARDVLDRLPGGAMRPRVPVPTSLRLTVSDVRVIDKTNELGRDELEFGAVVMNPLTGQSLHVPPIALGEFRRDDRKNEFSPVRVCEIPLVADAIVPQFTFANVFLGEIDRRKGRGGFADFVAENGHLASREILKAVNDLQIASFFALSGAALGGTALAAVATSALSAVALGLAGVLGGLLVGIVAGAVAILLFEYLFVAGPRDEIFGGESIGQTVAPDGTLDLSPTQTVTFERPHAAYDLTFKWEVEFALGDPPPPPPTPFGELPDFDPEADANLREKVDHIVVLMLENRSFDHMLGYLTALRGRTDVDGLKGDEKNTRTSTGEPFTVRPLSDTIFELDPPHHISTVKRSIETTPPMGGFVDEFVGDPSFVPGKHSPDDVLGYYRPEHVPVYDFLAQQFAVCDKWHCSFAGNTWINRTIAIAGAPAVGTDGKLFVGNEMPLLHGRTAQAFVRKIDEEFNASLRPGEQEVDWRGYAQDFSSLFIIDPDYVPLGSDRLRTMDDFLDDLASGDLPQVSWLDPNYVDFGEIADAEISDDGGFPGNTRFPRTANDDHPPTDIARGQALLATLVFSIMQSPLWEKIMLVITYDEHGGMYDHVEPPENPAQPESDHFARLGIRVPAFVVSPWVEAGSVAKTQFDHTTIIKTILKRFCERGGEIPDVSPRVDASAHLGHVLTRTSPRFVRAARAGEAPATGRAPVLGRSPAGERAIGGAARGGLPRPVLDDVLVRLGRRLVVAEARPPVARPPTDLERDIAQVRAVAGGGVGANKARRPRTAAARGEGHEIGAP